MDPPPNEAAQEAALSAVNLAPAAAPSTPTASGQPPAETLPYTHGLLILERTPDGNPSWLACKFCPIFGCRKRYKGYLRLYLAPFNIAKIESHLNRDHHNEWTQFRNMDEQKKKEFFQGKTLPPPAVFRKRLEELRKVWSRPKPKKPKKRKKVEDRVESAQQQHKKPVTERVWHARLPQLPPLLSHSEDCIGRTSFVQKVEQPNPLSEDADEGNSNSSPADNQCGSIDGVPRMDSALPGMDTFNMLSATLKRYSSALSSDLGHLVKLPLESEKDAQTYKTLFSLVTDDNALFAARTFFYLLRGLPTDVVATFLRDADQGERHQRGDSEKTPADVEMTEEKQDVDTPEKEQDSNMTRDQQNAGTPDEPQVDVVKVAQEVNIPQRQRDWSNLVSTFSDAVGMASMLALKRVISLRGSWARVLITRSCPFRRGAVEVLTPVLWDQNPLHIISIRDGRDSVETLVRLLDFLSPKWRSRLIGIQSRIPATDAQRKAVEMALKKALSERISCDLEVIDDSVSDDMRPIYPWVLARMTTDDFREIVTRYLRASASQEGETVQKLREQISSEHAALCTRKNLKDGPWHNKPWKEHEDLEQLIEFIQGLELLWSPEKEKRGNDRCALAGLVTEDDLQLNVDIEVERILRARLLMQIEQMEDLDEKDRRPRGKHVAERVCDVRWGANWSNLLVRSAGLGDTVGFPSMLVKSKPLLGMELISY